MARAPSISRLARLALPVVCVCLWVCLSAAAARGDEPPSPVPFSGRVLRKGDRVRINHSARPAYLHGEPGTVIDWAGDKIVIRLDEPVGRFINGEVRCPPGVLEPLSPRPE